MQVKENDASLVASSQGGSFCDPFLVFSSIKHDLARSGFKFWLKIGDEGDKISRKKTGEALAD